MQLLKCNIINKGLLFLMQIRCKKELEILNNLIFQKELKKIETETINGVNPNRI